MLVKVRPVIRSSCETLILIWRYRPEESVVGRLPRDVLGLIVKSVWGSRFDLNVWREVAMLEEAQKLPKQRKSSDPSKKRKTKK